MATVLTSMDAATVLSSGVAEVPTGSGSIPTADPPATGVPTGSDVIPTAGLIFATATVVTPYTRRKGKEKMIESETPKKKMIQEYMDIQMARQEEAERFKRKGIRFEQESMKKLKTSEEVKASEEVPKEKVKEMMQLVPIEEVYVEALQVKHSNIDWKVHTEGHRSYWKTTRLGGSSASYQFFVDMLKHLDREDLNQLWRIVKESLSTRSAASDKEMELWMELKRLYEPDVEDRLWTHTQNLMHAPVEWKLYNTCGVHHVTSKDKEISMLVEKDYPLKKGLAIVMISYKLQVQNYSQMANDLILNIYKIANYPSQQVLGRNVGNKMHKAFPLPVMEFPLPREVPTVSEESSHCQKKRDATAKKITLPLKLSNNCQSKSYDNYAKIRKRYPFYSSRLIPYLRFDFPYSASLGDDSGSLRDKIICDLNKTPDLSQGLPQNYPKCGNPVDGHYCQGCALLRKKFKEDLFTYCIENVILQYSFEPSNDNTNVVYALQEPFVVKHDPGDEYFDIIPATELDEFIKSSVENLVPNPSDDDESFLDEDIVKEIYSNLMFDEEIISMKIDPHHFNAEFDLMESLLNHDSSIISSSSKIYSLFDEFAGELTLLKSIPPGINETDCDPEEETRFIMRLLYYSSSPQEIDLSFTLDDPMPPGIEEDDYDSKRDILILEEFLNNDSLSLPKNGSFHFDIPSSSCPPAKSPDVSVGCQKPGHLAVRLGCAETKVATWDDLAFKLITLGWKEMDIKEKNKIRAKTGQNQTANGKRGKVQSQARQSQSLAKTRKHQAKENTT
nr:hypothetical protein [Tanacetum cinerariifolium]